MSDEAPFKPELVMFIEAERNCPGVSDSVFSRAERRMEMALVVGASGPAIGAAAAGHEHNVHDGRSKITENLKNNAAGLWASKMSAHPFVTALTAFAVGGAAGAGLHAEFQAYEAASSSAVAVTASGLPPSPSTVAPAAPPPTSIPIEALPDSASSGSPEDKPGSASRATDGAGRQSSLASERLLLESARTALSRGDSSSALVALNRHIEKFPLGELAEEREALYVQALVSAGRQDEAIARGARFHEQFPRSMLGPSVDGAVGR